MNPTPHPPLQQLALVRLGVRAVLALGVAASIAANVLHAQPTAVGRAIAAWSPLALLLTVELISRVPVTGRALSGLRMTATAAIAGIAAWVSYWHMVSVAARYGEQTTSAHLLPLSVDGLVIVASISLVEIAGRLRTTDLAPATAEGEPAAGVTAPTELAGEVAGSPPPDATQEPSPGPAPAPARPRRTARPAATSAAVKVARLRERHPDWTVPRIAERAGVSERTARRHLNQRPASTGTPGPMPAPADGPAAAELAA